MIWLGIAIGVVGTLAVSALAFWGLVKMAASSFDKHPEHHA